MVDLTNIHATDLKILGPRTTISESHRVLSCIGLNPQHSVENGEEVQFEPLNHPCSQNIRFRYVLSRYTLFNVQYQYTYFKLLHEKMSYSSNRTHGNFEMEIF